MDSLPEARESKAPSFFVRFISWTQGLTRPEAIALLLRAVIALIVVPFTSWTYDVYVFYEGFASVLYAQGLYGHGVYGYPPLWGFVFVPLLWIGTLLFGIDSMALQDTRLAETAALTGMVNATVTSPLFNFLLKTPLIFVDFLCAVYIRRIVALIMGPKQAKAALLLWVLNPITFVASFVQGQFDLIPGVAIVLSAVALWRKDFLFAGVWVAIGGLMKIFPVFLIPLYVLTIVSITKNASPVLHGFALLRKATRGILSFMLGGLLVVGLFFPSTLQFLSLLRYRLETAYSGGLTIWILNLLSPQTQYPTDIISLWLTVFEIIGLLVTALYVLRVDTRDLSTILRLQTISVALILATSLLVQPQYVCWLVPSAVLVTGLTSRFGFRTFVLSCLSTAFICSLITPVAFFYPLAVFTGLVRPESLNAIVDSYWQLGSSPVQTALLVISGVGAVITTVSMLIPWRYQNRYTSPFARFLADRSLHGTTPISWPPTKIRKSLSRLRLLTAAFLLLLVVGELSCLQTTHEAGVPTVRLVGSSVNNSTLSVQCQLDSGEYRNSLVSTLCLVNSTEYPRDAYVYYEGGYPTLGTRSSGLPELSTHLSNQFLSAGLNITVHSVNATGLRQVLLDPTTSIVISAAGILPQTVFTNTTDLVGPWLRNGGIMFWAGAPIGLYSGIPNHPHSPGSWDPGFAGQLSILGFTLPNGSLYPPLVATSPSYLSSALGIEYDQVTTGYDSSFVALHNGQVIGKLMIFENGTERTSSASFPVGQGFAILFGGGLTNSFTLSAEDSLASDISRILASRIIYSVANATWAEDKLSPFETRDRILQMNLPPAYENLSAVLIVFQNTPYPRYLLTTVSISNLSDGTWTRYESAVPGESWSVLLLAVARNLDQERGLLY